MHSNFDNANIDPRLKVSTEMFASYISTDRPDGVRVCYMSLRTLINYLQVIQNKVLRMVVDALSNKEI